MNSQQIIVNNQLISYLEEGTAGQKCLLFLHGWRSKKEVWNDVVGKLSEYQIYTIDLPGFGQSPAPKTAWKVGDYAETVFEFIKKLNLQNVIIVGHSFGGRVGIKLSATHPEIISKLVLVDSAGFAMGDAKKSAMNLAAKIVKPIFKPKIMQGLRKEIYKAIGSEDYVATPELQETFKNVVNEDLTEAMAKISCPTFIVFGENDKETSKAYGARMNRLISKSQLKILKQAGHFSFLDQPEEFKNALLDFIK